MSALDNMAIRLNYAGGTKQIDRMNEDKLRSLKRSLLYSYQSCTIRLEDGREFRALINRDKLKPDYEDKILSIPFEDICLNKAAVGKTKMGLEETGIKAGDTFTWISNSDFIEDTYWIIYLQNKEETAYFRGELRECNQEVEINGNRYHTWFKGPEQDSIEWSQKHNIVWNDVNYTRVMYISKNEETLKIFHRFAQFYLEDGVLYYNSNNEGRKNRWEVQAVNGDYGNGIIRVAFKEYYGETVPEIKEDEVEEEDSEIPSETDLPPAIYGKDEVYPYDEVIYSAIDTDDIWSIDNNKAEIREQGNGKCTILVTSSKKGQFTLTYGDLTKVVKIKSL